MRSLVPTLVAALALVGCAAPQQERADPAASRAHRTSAPALSQTAVPPVTAPRATLSVTPARSYPAPSPARPRLGRPFTAPILSSGRWILARVTLVAIDTYTGPMLPGLRGTPLLFRWEATNIDDHALPAAHDPVSYRLVATDDRERPVISSGFPAGSAEAPGGCRTLREGLVWKPGQRVSGCSVQTVRTGARLDRAALLCGDIRSPQAAEFDFS